MRHYIFAGALVLLLGTMGYQIYYNEHILTVGETTVLETRPVDPRDLLRGEYVILRYAIETDELVVAVAREVVVDGPIFIQLAEDNRGVAYVVSATRDAAAVSPRESWIEGTVEDGRVRLYDIEQYYVPEGTGGDIEQMRGLYVEIALYNQQPRVVRLLDTNLAPL